MYDQHHQAMLRMLAMPGLAQTYPMICASQSSSVRLRAGLLHSQSLTLLSYLVYCYFLPRRQSQPPHRLLDRQLIFEAFLSCPSAVPLFVHSSYLPRHRGYLKLS